MRDVCLAFLQRDSVAHTPVVLGSRPHLALLLRWTLGDKERGKEIVLVRFFIFFLSFHVA